MAVSRNGKRRIEVGGRPFYWFVAEEPDGAPENLQDKDLRAVTILSEDKAFLVRYYIGQLPSAPESQLLVIGKEFAGSEFKGRWRRFSCPLWCKGGVVTPSEVRSIIEWALGEKETLREVEW